MPIGACGRPSCLASAASRLRILVAPNPHRRSTSSGGAGGDQSIDRIGAPATCQKLAAVAP
jgi:hypothetical protein